MIQCLVLKIDEARRNIVVSRRALIEAEFPNLFVSLSSDVVAELREYPRAVTTCANAYVQPLMDRYLENFERALSRRAVSKRAAKLHRSPPIGYDESDAPIVPAHAPR